MHDDREHANPNAPQGFAAPAAGSAGATAIPPKDQPARPIPSGHAKPTTTSTWTPPASPRRSMAALIALSTSAFLLVTAEIAPLGLIQLMAEDLGRSKSEIGYVTTTFAVVVMLSTVPLTLLTTKLPRRSLIVGTMVFWSTGVLVAATASAYEQLLAGRALQAMGHALFWAVVTPAAAGMFAPEMRGRSVTRLMLGAAAAGVVGLPASTWLAQQTSWQVPFWILGLAGIAMAATIAVLMPSFRTEEGSAARGDFPSLGRFLRILAVVLLTTGAMATTWTYITPFAVDVAGFQESSMPLLLAAGGAVGVVAMWLSGKFLDRWPVKSVALGQGLLLLMWVGLATVGHTKVGAAAMITFQGLAWSLLVAAMVNWAMRHTPWSSDIGVGAYASFFNAGNAVGSTLGASMLAWWGAQWLPWASGALTATAAVLVWTVVPLAARVASARPMRSTPR